MGYLHKAVIAGNGQLLQTLLDNHVEPDGRDEYGATPLHAACFAANMEAVAALIGAGCTLDAKLHGLLNNREWTALQVGKQKEGE